MTDKVQPSFGRDGRARLFSVAVAYGGASRDGFVWPSSSRLVEDPEGHLATGALAAFNHAATSGLDVTIDTGEAVVRGAYLARDVQTTITLPASSTVDVYLGWRDGKADTILIGSDDGSSADAGWNATDPKTKIWTFTTDSSTVTGTTDHRRLGDAWTVPNDAIEALVNLASGDQFSQFPLDHDNDLDQSTVDPADHHAKYTDAEAVSAVESTDPLTMGTSEIQFARSNNYVAHRSSDDRDMVISGYRNVENHIDPGAANGSAEWLIRAEGTKVFSIDESGKVQQGTVPPKAVGQSGASTGDVLTADTSASPAWQAPGSATFVENRANWWSDNDADDTEQSIGSGNTDNWEFSNDWTAGMLTTGVEFWFQRDTGLGGTPEVDEFGYIDPSGTKTALVTNGGESVDQTIDYSDQVIIGYYLDVSETSNSDGQYGADIRPEVVTAR